MEIKIKEWNVNFGSDKDAEICKFAKEYINDTDIIVFTEVIDMLSYGLIKNDQIITKNICLKDSYYDWGYVRDNEWMYKDMLYNNRYKKGNKIEHGYPDHAILNAVIEL